MPVVSVPGAMRSCRRGLFLRRIKEKTPLQGGEDVNACEDGTRGKRSAIGNREADRTSSGWAIQSLQMRVYHCTIETVLWTLIAGSRGKRTRSSTVRSRTCSDWDSNPGHCRERARLAHERKSPASTANPGFSRLYWLRHRGYWLYFGPSYINSRNDAQRANYIRCTNLVFKEIAEIAEI